MGGKFRAFGGSQVVEARDFASVREPVTSCDDGWQTRLGSNQEWPTADGGYALAMLVALRADGIVGGIALAACMRDALIRGTLTIEAAVVDACR
jgi:hypothetical protein